MPVRHVTPILNVSNVEASVDWFGKLGWRVGFLWRDKPSDPVSFGSVCAGEGEGAAEIFLCLDFQGPRGTPTPAPRGQPPTDGVWMSWWVENPAEVDAVHATALSHNMLVTWPPTNEPWGVREFHLRHPDGHVFRVSAGTGEE
ncbi:MAG TPA: VOC family protein [Hyphomonadaceae bacterium]|jgi:catechol 2,3-dioxygenase-like lactoylglutathione lyase family enzyme|nr:VOC family protein [Hyphomonadaceae bacterium]